MAALSMSFVVHGDYLTETVREMVLSERWAAAYSLLVEDLDGMDHPTAVAILNGEKKLTGNSNIGVDIEDDDDTEYKNNLKYLYAGYVQHNGKWYKPEYRLAVFKPIFPKTNTLNEKVYSSRMGDEEAHGSKSRQSAIQCNMNYAAEWASKGDIIAYVIDSEKRDNIVIFTRTDQPPFWQHKDVIPTYTSISFDDAWEVFQDVEGYASAIGDMNTIDSEIFGDNQEWNQYWAQEWTKEAATNEVNEGTVTKTPSTTPGDLIKEADSLEAAEYESMRLLIRERADGEFTEVEFQGKTLSIPTAPLLNWALLEYKKGWDISPMKWDCVSRPGMKISGDDPYHTDWWIGAGLPLDMAYRNWQKDCSDYTTLQMDLKDKLQEKYLKFEITVLGVGNGQEVYGETLLFDRGEEQDFTNKIAVMSNADARHWDKVHNAKAIICETGGALAHMISLANEEGILVVREEYAIKKYGSGVDVTIDPNKGTIRLSGV